MVVGGALGGEGRDNSTSTAQASSDRTEGVIMPGTRSEVVESLSTTFPLGRAGPERHGRLQWGVVHLGASGDGVSNAPRAVREEVAGRLNALAELRRTTRIRRRAGPVIRLAVSRRVP